MTNPKILIACEESQAVTAEFRKFDIEAWSCDILPTSGPYPEYHLQQDVLEILDQDWSMIIAFPPCTDLAVSGAKWFAAKRQDGSQQRSIDFFMKFANSKCERVVIENPVGIMSSVWRKPDQIIQPWQFGDSFTKTTCLWLKGVPPLKPTNIVDPGKRVKYASGKSLPEWYANAPVATRKRLRSITFPGIARAMAKQWYKYVK